MKRAHQRIFNNVGDLTVNADFGNFDTTGNFNNTGNMSVGRDFGNFANFHTECMVSVGRDWANFDTISGPSAPPGCGGFTVVGASANFGWFAIDNSSLDMCDQGSPPLGFDLNTGTVGVNVSYCSCNNNCLVGIDDHAVNSLGYDLQVYPNPFSRIATIGF